MIGIEDMWRRSMERRKALFGLMGFFTDLPLLNAQEDPSQLNALDKHLKALTVDEMLTAFDFERVFFSNVPLENFDYVERATDGEWTKQRNREMFRLVEIVARPAIDVSAVNLSTELLGIKIDSPFFVCPTGSQFRTHPTGPIGMRRGSSDAKTLMVVPQVLGGPSSVWDDTVNAGDYPFFFQFYPEQNLIKGAADLERMQANGARAIVVTCDQQSNFYPRSVLDYNLGGKPIPTGQKRYDIDANGVVNVARGSRTAGLEGNVGREDWWYTWDYIDQIRKVIKVPMVAKGIITPEDAETCIQHGVDCIYVSNHGGRSLDYEPSALEVLPEIVATVRGRVPVIADSGVRTGTDAFKMLALGAKAVGMGRATRWALGAYGPPGVTKLFEVMKKELTVAMAQAGRPTVASIDQTAVRTHFV